MNYSEYYSSPEHWPQPPDEPCTLDSVEKVSVSRKRKKASGRVRKKMSESLAGVTAAAVAIVMVATSIPELGFIADGIPVFPDLPELNEPEEICSICNDEDCPYFEGGYPALVIRVPSEAEPVESDDMYSMLGFSTEDLDYYNANHPAVFTNDFERLVLRYSWDMVQALPILDRQDKDIWINNASSFDGEGTKVAGVAFWGDDDKSPYQVDYFHVVIAYDSGGTVPKVTPELLLECGEDPDYLPGNPEYIIRDIPGVSNAQLQVCTNLETEFAESLMDMIEVEVVDGLQVMDLGKTMRFTETERYCRNYYDIEYGSIYHHRGFNIDGFDQTRALGFATHGKEYQLSENELIFHESGWKAIFDTWQDLNLQAPETGHEVYYPLVQLNGISVNSIDYDCYMAYSSYPIDDVNNYQWAWLYVVPRQEETMAVAIQMSVSPEQLMKLLEKGVDPEDGELEILNQITLR